MRVLIVFVIFIAAAVAFPFPESKPDMKPELQPEQQTEQKNTLHSVDAGAAGDKNESEAERAKRFIFPFVFASVVADPVYYEVVEPVETRTVVKTVKTAPVVTKSTSVVKTKVVAPFVDVDVDV